MVLAKTIAMHAHLVAEFFLHGTTKHYLAIVAPAPSRTLPDEGLINIPVHRWPAKSAYQILKQYNHNDDDNNNNNINNNNNKDGNSTKDDYNSIPTWMMRMKTPTVNPTMTTTTTINTCWDAALAQVKLLTGRKHQIRVHCAQGLQCPVNGDPLYYGSSQNNSIHGWKTEKQSKGRCQETMTKQPNGSGIWKRHQDGSIAAPFPSFLYSCTWNQCRILTSPLEEERMMKTKVVIDHDDIMEARTLLDEAPHILSSNYSFHTLVEVLESGIFVSLMTINQTVKASVCRCGFVAVPIDLSFVYVLYFYSTSVCLGGGGGGDSRRKWTCWKNNGYISIQK
jgi:hypothetical protein